MVKLILATDMAKHKEILDELIKYVPNFDFKKKEHLESVIKYFWKISFSIVIIFKNFKS